MYSHQVDSKGLYLPSTQISEVPQNVRHESIIVPSTSQPNWGGYFVFDFREKSCIIHDLAIQFQVGQIVPQTGDASPVPRYTSCHQWYNRIELVLNNNVIDTIYPVQQFLLHNLFLKDEKRRIVNTGAGMYNNVTSRYTMSQQSTNLWHLPLWTFFKNGHLPMLYPKDDLQLRVYMDTFANSTVLTSGKTYATPSISANLIVDLTRLGQEVNLYKLQELNKRAHHYKFNELRYASISVSNISTSAPTSIILNAITGRVSFLMFVVRPSSTGLTNDNELLFARIKDFSILDSTSTNISGGQVVTHEMYQSLLAYKWVESTFLTEIAFDGASNMSAYLYCFGAEPGETAETGATFNSHLFQGNEQLIINWRSDTVSQGYQIDVFAHVEGCIESTPSYVRKITV